MANNIPNTTLQVEISNKQILSIAMPIALAMLVPQINFVANTVFLSGLGETELGVAGITGVYYLVFALVGNGLNSGQVESDCFSLGANLLTHVLQPTPWCSSQIEHSHPWLEQAIALIEFHELIHRPSTVALGTSSLAPFVIWLVWLRHENEG